MSSWLGILIGILVILAIMAIILIIIVFRRINIVFKKIDYIAEDITYKTESLSYTFDALKGFSKYVNLIQSLIDENADEQKMKYIQENKKKILGLSNYLRKLVDEPQMSRSLSDQLTPPTADVRDQNPNQTPIPHEAN